MHSGKMYMPPSFSLWPIKGHLPCVHPHADDDTQLYLAFKLDDIMNESAAVMAMQDAIDNIMKWMIADKPKLKDAIEFMIIGTRQQARQSV